jgi:hypothetical protein
MQPSGSGLVDALPAWSFNPDVSLTAVRKSPVVGAWPSGPPGRRAHLLHCRFNC